ncbi:MAG: PD-(D/E)XK nuclease family protein, partial [Candidatus Edwardsbacteria bacterium]|nr:PD-(D/E)XK nuclease family protein [Candidatus Edwardsbacteria bacterium]
MKPFSHSRLETFEQCPCKYKLAYIERPKIEKLESIEAFMGGLVHDVLEKHYRDLIVTRRNSVDELLAYYGKIWEQNWDETVRVVKKDRKPEHYRQAGRQAIEKYYARYQPFDRDTTIACELMLNFTVGDYPMTGYVDRLCHDGKGRYEIHDYKTSGRLPKQAKFDQDRQLALYQIGLRQMYPNIRDARLVWHYLLFDLEMESTRANGQLADLEKETAAQIKRILQEEKFPPHESRLCDWCEYFAVCPAKAHEIITAGLPPNEYLGEPGVELVNGYVKLQEKIKALRSEIAEREKEKDKIEEAAINLTRREGLAKLVGSGYELVVTNEVNLRFPGAQEEGRKELETYLKQHALWDRASSLNTGA